MCIYGHTWPSACSKQLETIYRDDCGKTLCWYYQARVRVPAAHKAKLSVCSKIRVYLQGVKQGELMAHAQKT